MTLECDRTVALAKISETSEKILKKRFFNGSIKLK